MSHETDQLLSEIMALLTVLRANINSNTASFPKPEPAPKPEPKPAVVGAAFRERTVGAEHVRVLWAIATCLGGQQVPSGTRVGKLADFSVSHAQRLCKHLEDLGHISRRTERGSISRIMPSGRALMAEQGPTPPWKQ